MQVDFTFLNNSPEELIDMGGMAMGLLSYEDKSEGGKYCLSYSVNQISEFDGFFRAARAFSLIANALLGISVLLLLCISCAAVRSSVITILSAMLIVGGVAEMLTFLMFFSSFSCDGACQLFFGAGLSLLCCIVTLINAAAVCHIPEAKNLECDDDGCDGDNKDGQIKRHGMAPGTPRNFTTSTGISASTSDSSDEWTVPKRISAFNQEVVLVLPDGSKQIIEPKKPGWCTVAASDGKTSGNINNTTKPYCGAELNFCSAP